MAWGFLALKGFLDLFVVSGSGETESAPNGNHLAIFARGEQEVGRDGICARREPPCDLGQQRVERRLPWKEPP